MKIIELFLEEDSIEGGVDGVAIVDKPAHESNFLTFNSELQDLPDRQYTYIGEMFEIEDQMRIAELVNTMGEPVGTLESQGYQIMSIEPVYSLKEEVEKELIENKFAIESKPNERSAEDTTNRRVRYKYILAPGFTGAIIDTSRTFCKDMLRSNRVFRIEDIIEMTESEANSEFGYYDILTWRGSYNCRHLWSKVVYGKIGPIVGASRPIETGSPAWAQPSTQVNMSDELVKSEFGILAMVDGQPLFEDVEDALKLAEILGCEGYHTHEVGEMTGFMACERHQFESYDDYPQEASDGACRVLKWIDEYGRDEVSGMELTGLQRANSLCKREPISESTIARMAGFERHRKNSEIAPEFKGTPWKDKGYVAWLAWGGTSGVEWAQNKLKQIREEMAEVGPRGGIRKTPKAPASSTPNKDPKGSGTAKGNASTTRGAVVSERVEKILKEKSDDFNERYKDKLGYGVDVGMLKTVYQRGVGAYNTSHSPAVKSAEQWSLARVNAFLELVKDGRPANKKYTTDYDLLPMEHPKREMDGCCSTGGSISGIENFNSCSYVEHGNTPTNFNSYGFKFDEEKMEITGAAIIPNKMIVRRNPITEELYYVFFSKETTKLLAEKFLKQGYTTETNLNHTDTKAKNTFVTESWIVTNPELDKSTALGLEFPEGTWVITMKVGNDELWEKIKQGKYNGFSIEGYFNEKLVFN